MRDRGAGMQDDFFGSRDARRKSPMSASRGKPKPARVTIRVTQSGEVAVSGLSRFPITLRKSQWDRLLGMSDEIRAFIAAHEGELLPEN
jgi:hypothetical protein